MHWAAATSLSVEMRSLYHDAEAKCEAGLLKERSFVDGNGNQVSLVAKNNPPERLRWHMTPFGTLSDFAWNGHGTSTEAAIATAGGVVDQSADAQRYLQTRGAGGLTLNQKTVLLPANPTRTAVYEELVHAEQFRRGVTLEAGRGGVLRFEIEAAETLIRNRQAWQLPADEVRQVIENLRSMRAELQRLTAGQ